MLMGDRVTSVCVHVCVRARVCVCTRVHAHLCIIMCFICVSECVGAGVYSNGLWKYLLSYMYAEVNTVNTYLFNVLYDGANRGN